MTAQSFLLRDVLVVPQLGEAPFHGWVEVDGGTIAAVGRGSHEASPDQLVVEGGGAALLAGLVNTHAHSHSSLTRGSAEGLPLEGWLAVIEKEQAQLTDEQAYVGALATYAEALLCGTTAIVDMCIRPEPAMAAARDIGIRAVIVPYVADSKPFAPTLEQNARLLDMAGSNMGNDANDRVRLWVGVHDLESCSDDCIRAAAELARERHTGLHLHCAETRLSVERTISRVGRTPVAQLHVLGALSERTVLAHCVWLSEEDRLLLASAAAHVAHCPHANLKLASGIAPVPDLCRRGINVTLATDGAKANNRLDMFDVMKFASLIHKGITGDPSVLPAARVVDMATARGAAALDLRSGAIIPGLNADLVLVRLDGFHMQPCVPGTLITNLVHAARGSDVSMVMVDGRILVQDGRLADRRWEGLLARARQVGEELLRSSAG
jgi:5-methylthioadenosine/S-adenosylhomocysteine deaminase